MNGYEALQRICSFNCVRQEFGPCLVPCEEHSAITRELKVLQILKKKSVDLGFIDMNMEDMSILNLTEEYNKRLFWRDIERHLTLEEMQLIVAWLKEVEDERS